MNDDRLRHLDAGFLEAEDGEGHLSMAIGALAILEGPVPAFADILSVLEQRSARLPHSRDSLRTSRLGLLSPFWTPDAEFEIGHHVRRVAVSPPGERTDLYRVAADLIERRLHRSRPLWEAWVIEGLSDGRWAMLIKIHHCIADGTAAAAMLSEVCDDRKWTKEHSPAECVPAAVRGPALPNPLTVVKNFVHTSVSLAHDAVATVTGAGQIIAGFITPAQPTLAAPLTDMRRFSAVSTPMDGVLLICNRFSVTVNDVALAAITDGFRSALQRRGILPQAGSMRTLVPVSVRSPDALHIADNRVSIMLPNLPVDERDPIDRLRIVHQRLLSTKRGGQRQAGSLTTALGNLIPYPVLATAVRLFIRLPQHGVITLATNIHGPEERLQFMDCPIQRLIPVPPILRGMQAGIAIMSYAGELTFGMIGDFDAEIGTDELAGDIEAGIGRLLEVVAADLSMLEDR
jgi:diacylglycerol O-acyltransferase